MQEEEVGLRSLLRSSYLLMGFSNTLRAGTIWKLEKVLMRYWELVPGDSRKISLKGWKFFLVDSSPLKGTEDLLFCLLDSWLEGGWGDGGVPATGFDFRGGV